MLNRYIDYTLLKADANDAAIEALCRTALAKRYCTVCVPPTYVHLAHQVLGHSSVRVCTVVGFPLGMHTPSIKFTEAEMAILTGAQEIDMMINLAALKSGRHEVVKQEIELLLSLTRGYGAILKVIIETGALEPHELEAACAIASETSPDFIKTSTGYYNPGAELDKVELLRQKLPPHIEIKAAGGIRSAEQAWEFVQAGATRIGASAQLV